MKAKIIEKEPSHIVFSLKCTPRFANTIRRYSMARVPTLAIDKVMIYENRTAFFDEYIANRIGQIPITMPNENIKAEEVGFYLDAVGPATVYSDDLASNNEKVKVAIEKIPLVKLAEGQSLRLEGYVKLGIGREHSKFQTAIASYKLEDDGSYTIRVETIGQVDAKTVLQRALKHIIADLKELNKSLKGF
ncbi:MAG: DNA-directed RNA polymerase subunit D [Methanobacteriota archaeon]|nr:MAG: DNA-directed RNA polymerase subunit D [Euryarchaeota archaeon]